MEPLPALVRIEHTISRGEMYGRHDGKSATESRSGTAEANGDAIQPTVPPEQDQSERERNPRLPEEEAYERESTRRRREHPDSGPADCRLD
jgi:hypothetical protein